MPRIERIGHTVLYVADVDACVAFYRDALGMEVVNYEKERGMAFMSFGTLHHDIGLFKDRGDGSRGSTGLAHIAFRIEGGDQELAELHERLVENGAKIRSITDHGMTHSVYFFDPEGNTLEIYADVFTEKEGLEYMRARLERGKPLELPPVKHPTPV